MSIEYDTGLSVQANKDAAAAVFATLVANELDTHYQASSLQGQIGAFQGEDYYLCQPEKQDVIDTMKAAADALDANYPSTGTIGADLSAASTQTAVEASMNAINEYDESISAVADTRSNVASDWEGYRSANDILQSATAFEGAYETAWVFTYTSPDADALEATVRARLSDLKTSHLAASKFAQRVQAQMASCMGSNAYSIVQGDFSEMKTQIDAWVDAAAENTSTDIEAEVNTAAAKTRAWPRYNTLQVALDGMDSGFAVFISALESGASSVDTAFTQAYQTLEISCTPTSMDEDGNQIAWDWAYNSPP